MTDTSLFRFNSNEKQKRIFRYSIISFIIIFLGIIIFFVVNTIINIDKTSEIRILVAPSDSTVTIDGNTYKTDSTIKIKPGTYNVKIEKPGFISYHGSIKANDSETSYLYEYLNEENENGTFYKDNEKENLIAQRISDLNADIFHQNYTGTDPIWNITPYYNYKEGLKITAEKENDNIIIKTYLLTCIDEDIPNLKQKALSYLEENKINLKNYTIKFSNC
ncbi:PEGA domain-containing protein [Candidatus Saccharibacteria bacterium]|nr:PEGA domain-containing protein [Candidatus Saccharibacteria bacterium]